MKRALASLGVLAVLAIIAALVWLFWAMRPLSDIADRALEDLPRHEPLKIVAFGTSLTKRNDWPEALDAALEDCMKQDVEITRVAKPGAGSDWGLAAVSEVIAASPDLVLMEFAINDADLRDGASLTQARDQHAAILRRLAEALPRTQILLMTMNPAHGLRGWMRPALPRHYAQYRTLAAAHGAGLLDLYPRWLNAPRSLRHFPDGLHPGNETARAVILPPLYMAIAKAAGEGACSSITPQPA